MAWGERCIDDHNATLSPQILARRESGHLFEETGEMMGKIETQKA